jgi:hypothetical protein
MTNWNHLTDRGRKVLDLALREALTLNHHYVGPEHLLLAAARDYLPDDEAEMVRQLVMKRVKNLCPTCGQQRPT